MAKTAQAIDRREDLLDAALAVFAEQGYNGAKVSDVVGRAGVAQGTFYLYFKSKHEVLLALVDRFCGLIAAACTDQRAQGNDFEGFRRALRERTLAILRIVAENRPLAGLFFKESIGGDPDLEARMRAFHGALASTVEDNLREAIARGLLRPIDTRIVGYALNGMWERVVIHCLLLSSEAPDLERIADELISLQLDGLRARQS